MLCAEAVTPIKAETAKQAAAVNPVLVFRINSSRVFYRFFSEISPFFPIPSPICGTVLLKPREPVKRFFHIFCSHFHGAHSVIARSGHYRQAPEKSLFLSLKANFSGF